MRRKKTVHLIAVSNEDGDQLWIATPLGNKAIRVNLVSPTLMTWLGERYKIRMTFARTLTQALQSYTTIYMGGN